MSAPLGTAHLSDEDFLAAFDSLTLDPASFRHADHLRLAWLLLRRCSPAEAEARLLDGIARFAARAGTPQKFSQPLTLAWLRLVAAADPAAAADFASWLDAHPRLLDKSLAS